jgi:hypothetical protein
MIKNIFILILAIISQVNLLSQINYQFTEGESNKPVFQNASPTNEINDNSKTKDGIDFKKKNAESLKKNHLVDAIRKTDISKINHFLSVELKKDILVIDSILNTFESQFENQDSVYLFENPTVSVSFHGTEGITQFRSRQTPKLAIQYQYYFDTSFRVSQITINDQIFPTSIERIYELEKTKWKSNLSVQETFNNYEELVKYIAPNNNEEVNDFYLPINHKYIAEMYGDLSWNAIQLEKNEEAIKYAKSGLEAYSEFNYLNSYLALSLAQNDKIEESVKIYEQYKEYEYRNSPLKYKFQKDIRKLEKYGVSIIHKERINKILSEQ